MHRVVSHLRGNAVAYLALFVALGGTSYAAINLPSNSVGTRQIRNHAITPVKLDPGKIGASVRAWAVIQDGTKVVAARPRARIVSWDPTSATGVLSWGSAVTRSCFPLASGGSDLVQAAIATGANRQTVVHFGVFTNSGQPDDNGPLSDRRRVLPHAMNTGAARVSRNAPRSSSWGVSFGGGRRALPSGAVGNETVLVCDVYGDHVAPASGALRHRREHYLSRDGSTPSLHREQPTGRHVHLDRREQHDRPRHLRSLDRSGAVRLDDRVRLHPAYVLKRHRRRPGLGRRLLLVRRERQRQHVRRRDRMELADDQRTDVQLAGRRFAVLRMAGGVRREPVQQRRRSVVERRAARAQRAGDVRPDARGARRAVAVGRMDSWPVAVALLWRLAVGVVQLDGVSERAESPRFELEQGPDGVAPMRGARGERGG